MAIFGSDEGTDSPGFSSDLSSGTSSTSGSTTDQELQEFFIQEKQKAEFSAQIHDFNDLCWEKCLTDKPGSKLGGKTETCLNNCVERFVDVSLFIANRFAMTLQKSANM